MQKKDHTMLLRPKAGALLPSRSHLPNHPCPSQTGPASLTTFAAAPPPTCFGAHARHTAARDVIRPAQPRRSKAGHCPVAVDGHSHLHARTQLKGATGGGTTIGQLRRHLAGAVGQDNRRGWCEACAYRQAAADADACAAAAAPHGGRRRGRGAPTRRHAPGQARTARQC